MPDGHNESYDQDLQVTENSLALSPIKSCPKQTLYMINEPMNKYKEMEPPITEVTLLDQGLLRE